MDAMGLHRALLAGHDWGGYVGYLMVLRAPERFDGFLVMNMTHPWQNPRAVLPHLWRLYYQLPIATLGVPLQRHTKLVNLFFKGGSEIDPAEARIFADRFRDPVCARAGRDTYGHSYSTIYPGVQGNPRS